MNRYSLTRIALIICVLGFGISAHGQEKEKEKEKAPDTEIIYTGKFLGYSRVPSLQTFTLAKDAPPCPAPSSKDSEAAIKFLAAREAHKNAILLGAGDNFAPELEARIFEGSPPPPPSPTPTPTPGYVVANKELFFSDGTNWFFYKNVPKSVEK